jgi:hypothetical protein
MVATVIEPVFCIDFGYPLGGFLDDAFQCLLGTGLCGAQPGFELAEGQFDGVEIGRVRGQIRWARA